MIVLCDGCGMWYDDEYRWTICPHQTFAANNGNNNFVHNDQAYIGAAHPDELQ